MLTNGLFMLAYFCLLTHGQSEVTEKYCKVKEESLMKLDIAEFLISKAKDILPNCTDAVTDTSDCGAKEKSSAHLDLVKKLISESKKNYPNCIEPQTKDPNIEEPETKEPVTEDPETKEPEEYPKYRDCSEVLQNGQNVSGVYTIWPGSPLFQNRPLKVFCDMETDGGGWTVIQRRGNFTPQEDFYRDWNDYKWGFGNVSRDFWLGNENIYVLSSQGKNKIRFDLESAEGEKAYAVYKIFWIDYQKPNYKLHIGNYSGNAGNSMYYHNEMPFSTKDRKNDRSDGNCAVSEKGGWWYNSCSTVNLNGVYGNSEEDSAASIRWFYWKERVGLAATEIKLKSL